MEKISCFCQNCRAANNLGDTTCRDCGTRLLLVVFPQSLKFDTNHVPSYYEDHLLERVTLLELRLAQATEQLAMAFELIKRESKLLHNDRGLLRSFFENLEKSNPELAKTLNQREKKTTCKQKKNSSAEDRREAIVREIIAYQGARQTELFSHLVREGFALLEKNEEKQAFQTFERALLISPDNVPLLLTVSENLFRVDKFSEAKKYLENLFELDSQSEPILLLLGAVCADELQIEKARKLLSVLVNNRKIAGLVNFIWAMLAAFEQNWTESLAAFRQCLEIVETPEVYYLIGCVDFQLENYKVALSNFDKAIALDDKFADAWFMKSVIYKLLADEQNAANSLKSAFESKEAGAQCLNYLNRQKGLDFDTALPFLHFKSGKNLLTKGSLRVNKFFREQIFQSLA